MNQRATANVGEMMEAQHDISTLKQLLVQANADATKWKIVFDAQVEHTNGGYGIVLTASAGGRHVSQFIGQQTVMYYAEDVETIAHQYASLILSHLLVELARDELGKVLMPAVKNVATLAAKNGFAK